MAKMALYFSRGGYKWWPKYLILAGVAKISVAKIIYNININGFCIGKMIDLGPPPILATLRKQERKCFLSKKYVGHSFDFGRVF